MESLFNPRLEYRPQGLYTYLIGLNNNISFIRITEAYITWVKDSGITAKRLYPTNGKDV